MGSGPAAPIHSNDRRPSKTATSPAPPETTKQNSQALRAQRRDRLRRPGDPLSINKKGVTFRPAQVVHISTGLDRENDVSAAPAASCPSAMVRNGSLRPPSVHGSCERVLRALTGADSGIRGRCRRFVRMDEQTLGAPSGSSFPRSEGVAGSSPAVGLARNRAMARSGFSDPRCCCVAGPYGSAMEGCDLCNFAQAQSGGRKSRCHSP